MRNRIWLIGLIVLVGGAGVTNYYWPELVYLRDQMAIQRKYVETSQVTLDRIRSSSRVSVQTSEGKEQLFTDKNALNAIQDLFVVSTDYQPQPSGMVFDVTLVFDTTGGEEHILVSEHCWRPGRYGITYAGPGNHAPQQFPMHINCTDDHLINDLASVVDYWMSDPRDVTMLPGE